MCQPKKLIGTPKINRKNCRRLALAWRVSCLLEPFFLFTSEKDVTKTGNGERGAGSGEGKSENE